MQIQHRHKQKGNIILDDLDLAKSIIESYEEISDVEVTDNVFKYVTFRVNNEKFLFICPDRQVPSSKVRILIVDNSNFNYPHIGTEVLDVQKGKKLPEGKYRFLCLYEDESVIFSLYTYEEKVMDSVERLIKLLNFSPVEIEKELQKEFLYYWNDAAIDSEVDYYLSQSKKFVLLNVYLGGRKIRCVEPGVYLNDKEKKEDNKQYWKHLTDVKACYIPIVDNRGILPPTKGHAWNSDNIVKIIYARQINHISHEAYQKISETKIGSAKMILTFGMNVEGITKIFSLFVTFKSSRKESILYKLQNEIAQIDPIKTNRVDYIALSEAIGNSINITGKKVLLIGAGSLGSYVSAELVKMALKVLQYMIRMNLSLKI